MHKFKFGGLSTKGIYLDETVMRMCYTHKRIFIQLAMELMNEGQDKKALEVLEYMEKQIPEYNVPVDYIGGSCDQARIYTALNKYDKARAILEKLWKKSSQYIDWYLGLDGNRFAGSQSDCLRHFYIMQQVSMIAMQIDKNWGDKLAGQLNIKMDQYHGKGGQFPGQ